MISKLGKIIINAIAEFGQITKLFLSIIGYLKSIVKSRKQIIIQMEHIGVNSLPLVIVISFFTGAITAWQASYQLKGLAPMSLLGTAVSKAIFTELGPVLTALVMAGRIGASIAAELGTMKVTEQIDALEVMGISPVRYLAMPRFIASIIMLPILVIFTDIIAILSSFLTANYFLDISSNVFFSSIQRFFDTSDIFAGLIKSTVFGATISLLGCHVGFETQGGAEGVGLATIKAFVLSASSILIADFLLWNFLFG
ncbi:MAG TPA: ABC transporter permease [Ignavibacteriales bacterium]|nr:ABC transporter permease [Ignavibacteriales bacterium]HOM65428.1 ABC transporter permease [Ignavibacteriales bacterium]HPD68379.1 ABC transporter permease [Ignavibacteriales bacterium]HRR19760.1 ABC transporter permease [Ignavibacteriales bacterium]HRT99712.1 ABC transporter permease [Ignavibacteriales bacterium]